MHFKSKYKLLLILIAYCISSLLVFLKFKNYFSPDLISYIAVSEKIIDGNFYDSVNGYWSPLISWLLVPFLAITKNGVISFQLLNLLIGGYLIYNCKRILDYYSKEVVINDIVVVLIALLVPTLALLNLTADILFLALLLQYYYWHTQNKIFSSPWRFALIGTLLYLSKAYGFYFFIAHQIIYFTIKNYGKWKKELGMFLAGFLAFFICCGSWVLIISKKYNTITLSTAATYNSAILTSDGTLLHPCDTMRMLPPDKTCIYTAWEEMYLHTSKQIAEVKSTGFSTTIIKKNLVQQYHLYNKTTRYGLLLFILLLALTLALNKKISKSIILPISLFLVFTSGYLLFFTEERYLFFPILLIVVMNTMLISNISLTQKSVGYLFYLLLSYSILRSAYDLYMHTNTAEEDIAQSISKQTKDTTTHNFATYYPYQLAQLAYLNHWKNYGGIIAYAKDSIALQNDLKNYAIDFLIIPDSIRMYTNIKTEYKDLHLSSIGKFQVWKRN